MYRLLIILALTFIPSIGLAKKAPSKAELENFAKSHVARMANEAIEILTTAKTRAERERGFRRMLDDHADMRRIARYTLGQYARRVKGKEFDEYVRLLNELIIKVYANRLGDYSNEQIEIHNVKSKKRNFIVSTRLVFTNGREPVPIEWWLVKKRTGGFELFDVRVLGVWMAQEQRDSFVALLQRNRGNFNALLDHLRNSIARGKGTLDESKFKPKSKPKSKPKTKANR